MKIIICGDIHINEQSIAEIEEIFEKDIFAISADRILQLGDYYDKNHPTPIELKFGTELAKKMKERYQEVIILSGTGEHDLFHDESVVSYLASIGVKTRRGDFFENNILYGHFMVNESRFAFGTGKYSKKDLEKYDAVFLGHQHTHQIIMPNIIHPGSIRYVTFNEVGIPKSIVLLEDNKPEYIQLKHCIPMIDVYDINQMPSIAPRTKVRAIFNSFEDYKLNASIVNNFGHKFFQFKIKTDFEESKILIQSSTKTNICSNKNNIIKDYIEKIVDQDVKKLLEEQFKENI